MDRGPGDEELRTLVRAAAAGDERAQAQLFARFRMPLMRLCLSFPGLSQADAQDLVQETIIRAMKGLGGLREPGHFPGWLFSICRRRCLTHLGKRSRRRRQQQRYAAEARLKDGVAQDEACRELERRVVREVVENMADAKLQEVGRLFYLEGLDTAAIAARLGSPRSTVTTWLSRFRAKVRRRLVQAILELRDGGSA